MSKQCNDKLERMQQAHEKMIALKVSEARDHAAQ